jgi:hypothetical protein
LQELQGEVQRQLQEVHNEQLSSTVKFTAGRPAGGKQIRDKKFTAGTAADDDAAAAAAAGSSSSSTCTANLFVSGLPVNRSAAAVRQQVLQQLSGRGVLSVTVPAVGHSRRCRGWAKLLLCDESAAAALLQQSKGQLAMWPGQPAAVLSWCCGRADALFPQLPFELRRQLRIDSVAAYSTTDGPTAAAMAALLAAIAAELLQQPDQQSDLQQQQQQDEGSLCFKQPDAVIDFDSSAAAAAAAAAFSGKPALSVPGSLQLSVTDLTACAGGNALAFAADGRFAAVTAVELDPDRAEDLLHNIQLVL